jgi:predicted nucleic acid-binding Zn ribbon protein
MTGERFQHAAQRAVVPHRHGVVCQTAAYLDASTPAIAVAASVCARRASAFIARNPSCGERKVSMFIVLVHGSNRS